MVRTALTLGTVRDSLPHGVLSVRGSEIRIEVDGRVIPGQPVIVSMGRGAFEVFHVAGRMYSTMQGRTLADVTFLREEFTPYPPCSVCGKPGYVQYTGPESEWACLMCHFWMTNAGLSAPSATGSSIFTVRSLTGIPTPEQTSKPQSHDMSGDRWGPFGFLLALNWNGL